jgi:hypothetical protein
MAAFYVKQRVRIKFSYTWPELAGEVGTILAASDPVPGRSGEWEVGPDVWGGKSSPPSGWNIFAPGGDQLEPATDANDKIEWDVCCWAPEHLRETV